MTSDVKPRDQVSSPDRLETSFRGLGLGLGLECSGLGLGLGLECSRLGLGLGLEQELS